jgi:hypothetical protein
MAIVLAAATVVAAQTPEKSSAGFHFKEVSDKSLGLWEGERPVLVYNHGPIDKPGARSRSSYIHPLYGLNGEVLTDDFPKDHVYHRGVFWAWPHVKIGEQEYDQWSLRSLGSQFERWSKREATEVGAQLAVQNFWLEGGKRLAREEVRLLVHKATADSRAIDVELVWTPLDQPITLWGAPGKSYGGFNFRFAPRTRTIISVPEGRTSDDLVVTKLPWADFSADFAGPNTLSGAAIFVHPQHRDYPPTWMTRHYGLMSVGWPGVEPQTLPAGEPVACRYRLWIHRGNPEPAEIQKAYEAYRDPAK